MSKNGEGKKLNHLICLDFETGGLDCQKSAITEVGAVIYRSDTFEEVGNYQSYITPHYTRKKAVKTLQSKKRIQNELFSEEKFLYDEKALTYSNITLEKLERYGKPITEVAKELQEFFKSANLEGGTTTKPYLLGQNITFDIGFLQQLAEVGCMELQKVLAGKTDYYGNFQPEYLDTLPLSKITFAHDESVTSHKLGFLCEILGIELIEAHSALDDVYGTGDVFRTLVNRMRSESTDLTVEGKKQEQFRNHFSF